MTELHVPVLLDEVLNYLNIREGGIYVDATLGDGGHAAAICSNLGREGRFIGIDWDGQALERAETRLAGLEPQINLVRSSYTRLKSILAELGISRVDGILLDLGVSTLQLMEPSRGFSIHREGPLDMRMDRRLPHRASDLVNGLPEDELARVIYRYGEERWARRIASRIVHHRMKEGPLETGEELAELVKDAIPAARRRKGGHPARRTFQGLRIAVNRELENIETVLPQTVESMAYGGRLCFISYHSLEDRIIKNFIRDKAKACSCSPRMPCTCEGEGELSLITPKVVRPREEEVEQNPRSRSARLRAAEYKGVLKNKAGE